jgi:hypothetical protein
MREKDALPPMQTVASKGLTTVPAAVTHLAECCLLLLLLLE